MAERIDSYQDLIVWQKAMLLCEKIYSLTEAFPQREKYTLADQMRRAAVSIPSNIAEGRGRGTRKDFAHFLYMAYGSASELETQLILAHRLRFISDSIYEPVSLLNDEVRKMLRAMIKKLM